jgi:hypothetical protein
MTSTPEDVFGHFRCPDGPRRDGLQLEGVFNLSPIARLLEPDDTIRFILDHPRLGLDESPAGLKTDFSGRRLVQSGEFPASAVEPIRVRFGYTPGQVVRTAPLAIPLSPRC